MRIPFDRFNELVLGFNHVVREGFVLRSILSRPSDNKWVYQQPIVGVITSGNDRDKVLWTVKEHQHNTSHDQFECFSIHDAACTEIEALMLGLCKECHVSRKSLLRRFTNAVEIRKKEYDPNTRDIILERSISLYQQKVESFQRESRIKLKRIVYRDKVIAKLTKGTGLDIPLNEESDSIFSNDELQSAVDSFLAEKEITQDGIVAYAFKESVRKHRMAREKGHRSVRHCPLMIRLGCVVHRKMGYAGGLYDFVAKIAGLPSDRSIRRYKVPNSNDPNGFMHGNGRMARDQFKHKHPNADMFAFERHVTVAMDAMHSKGRFGVNHHTNELMSIANNAFDEDVIEQEMKQLQRNDINEGEMSEMVLPEMAKHFLVFSATSWSSKGRFQFLVARYGLKTITSSFLVPIIQQHSVTLAVYGWIVDTIVGDGVSKNRAAFKQLATIPAREIFENQFSDEDLSGLPLDFKIGFPHPSPLYGGTVTIVIGGDMPHWVKKFRNAFENKSCQLTFRGKKMDLSMIYDVWHESGDASTVTGSLRKYNKTHDHFNPNAYLKM